MAGTAVAKSKMYDRTSSDRLWIGIKVNANGEGVSKSGENTRTKVRRGTRVERLVDSQVGAFAHVIGTYGSHSE